MNMHNVDHLSFSFTPKWLISPCHHITVHISAWKPSLSMVKCHFIYIVSKVYGVRYLVSLLRVKYPGCL